MKKKFFNRLLTAIVSFSLLFTEAAPLSAFASDEDTEMDVCETDSVSEDETEVCDEQTDEVPEEVDEDVIEEADNNGDGSTWNTPPEGWTNKVASYTDTTDHIIYDLYLVSGEYKLFIYSDSNYNLADSAITTQGAKRSNELSGYWDNITEITVNAVYKISKSGLFSDMRKLKTVTLGIDKYIPTCYEIDAEQLFYNCTSLESITIPGMLETIPVEFAYFCKNLKTVTINESNTGNYKLQNIGNYAFSQCSSLESFDLDKVISNLTTIGEQAFFGCENLGKNQILDFSTNSNLKKIDNNAFRNTGYNTVKLPNNRNITYGSGVFSMMKNLTTFYFGINIMSEIPDYMFYECENLTTIYGGNTGTEKNKLPKSIASGITVKKGAFYGCKHLGDGDNEFKMLESSDIKEVEEEAFAYSGVKGKVNIKTIGKNAFYDCDRVTEVSSKNIGEKAFYGCDSLTKVSSSQPETIGDYAFADCSNLNDVIIYCPEDMSTTNWGKGIFKGCVKFSERAELETSSAPRIELLGKTADELNNISWISDKNLFKEWIGTPIKSVLCNGGYLIPGTWVNLEELDLFSMDSITLKNGTSLNFMMNYDPSSADDSRLILENSNPNVVTVEEFPSLEDQLNKECLPKSLCFKALKNGSARITIKSVTGNLSDSCNIVVNSTGDGRVWVTGVTDNTGEGMIPMKIGETLQAKWIVTPGNATNNAVHFKSDNEEVITISNTGLITAVGEGTARFSVISSENAYYRDSREVQVSEVTAVAVTGVEIPETISLSIGESKKLTAAVLPEDAADKSVTYSSDNTAVATVDAEGVVNAIKAGTATVTVTTNDGGFTDTCIVTVTEDKTDIISVNGVSVSPKSVKIYVEESKNLTVTVTPEDATDKSVSFKSSDPSILIVSNTGEIMGVSDNTINDSDEDIFVGKATVTVTTTDGGFTDYCEVSVYLKADSVGPVDPVPGRYVVSFYDGDGLIHSETVPEGQVVKLVPDLIKEGKTFAGWWDKEAHVFWGTDSPVYRNISVIARFKDNNGVLEPIPEDPDVPVEESTGYEFLAESSVGRDIYLVKGQKIFINSNSVQTGDKKVLSASKPKNNAVTVSAKKAGNTSLTIVNVSGNIINYDVHVEAPVFMNKSLKLEIGWSTPINLLIGSNADKYDIYYTSSNSDVAVVEEGKVYGISKGSATITAHVNGKRYNCKVSVKDPSAPKSVKDGDFIIMPLNQSFSLKFSDKFNAKKALWSIENSSVANIKNGKLTATKAGFTKATGLNGGVSRTLSIIVTNPSSQTIHISAGKSKNIRFFKLNNKSAIWTVSDNSIASVVNGKVTGLRPGITEVTAVVGDVNYKTFVVVEDPLVSTDSKLVQNGKKYNLSLSYKDAYFLTLGGTSQKAVFTSSRPDIARVDENNRVIAAGVGKAKLTAKVNGKTITVNVVVN